MRFLRSMSSNEDQSAVRDREEKETEEVEVGGEAVEGGPPFISIYFFIILFITPLLRSINPLL